MKCLYLFNWTRRRGFSHDYTLGEEKQNYAWRQELDKIRSQKPLRVSELIGTFNRREPVSEDETEAAVKQRRRASLNIQGRIQQNLFFSS